MTQGVKWPTEEARRAAIAAAQKRWRLKNPETEKTIKKRYYDKNKEYYARKNREYHAANRETIVERNRW